MLQSQDAGGKKEGISKRANKPSALKRQLHQRQPSHIAAPVKLSPIRNVYTVQFTQRVRKRSGGPQNGRNTVGFHGLRKDRLSALHWKASLSVRSSCEWKCPGSSVPFEGHKGSLACQLGVGETRVPPLWRGRLSWRSRDCGGSWGGQGLEGHIQDPSHSGQGVHNRGVPHECCHR